VIFVLVLFSTVCSARVVLLGGITSEVQNFNWLGPNNTGVIALGKALEVNSSLQELYLVSCRVVVFVALFAGDAATRAVCFGLFLPYSMCLEKCLMCRCEG
jgi:hypothetical protein